MDAENQLVVESVYHETAAEALARGDTPLTAHKEAVIAASMLLSSLTGVGKRTGQAGRRGPRSETSERNDLAFSSQCPSGDFMSRMNRLSGGPS